ncbi:MAG: cobalamin biosynthesis protein CobT [Methylovirgula sp.]
MFTRELALKIIDLIWPEARSGKSAKITRWASKPLKAPPAPSCPPPYLIYTREFDRTVPAEDLDSVVGSLSDSENIAFDEAVRAFREALLVWRTKAAIAALDATARIRQVVTAEELSSTVVCLLVDHSGSMCGSKILLAAAASDVAVEFLELLGTSVEVLGFTTVEWQGGKSRQKWLKEGRSPAPGRLCDLLHIVYRSSAERTSNPALWRMLRPGLHKENIDGEAIEWAAARLRERPEQRKILVVISDGTSVDDSTLLYNDEGILDRHLRQVIIDLEASEDIELAALGIGFDVMKYYSLSKRVSDPNDLGETLIDLLEDLISYEPPGMTADDRN